MSNTAKFNSKYISSLISKQPRSCCLI